VFANLSKTQGYFIKVKCPFCNRESEIYIDKEEIARDPSGIIRIPIEHETPEPHLLVIDIDLHGFVRGAYLIRGYAVLEEIPVFAMINIVGMENFAKLLCWLLAYDNVHIYGFDQELVKSLRILLAYIFKGRKKLVPEEKARIKIDVFNVPFLEFSIDLIIRRLRFAIDRVKDSRSLVAYLRHEIGKYLDCLQVFEKVVNETAKRLTIRDLIQITENKLRDDEVKFLLAVLRAKGIEVEKKVTVPEFKITEIF